MSYLYEKHMHVMTNTSDTSFENLLIMHDPDVLYKLRRIQNDAFLRTILIQTDIRKKNEMDFSVKMLINLLDKFLNHNKSATS